TAQVNIPDNLGTQILPLSGTGTVPLGLSSTSLKFGRVPVGSTGTLTLTVSNPVGDITVQVNGTTLAPFGDTLAASCGSLAGGSSCTVSVTFSPTVGGIQNGTLTISDNVAGSAETVSLSGKGTIIRKAAAAVAPAGTVALTSGGVFTSGPTNAVTPTGVAALTLSAAKLDFKGVSVGSTRNQTLTVTNPEGGNSIALSVAATSPFEAAPAASCSSLAAGSSCTIKITFSPTSNGEQAGRLTLSFDGSSNEQIVSLSGEGLL
ncbi:MAG: hypothetical protein DMG21_07675, partial [Acidobacteria bacterium]